MKKFEQFKVSRKEMKMIVGGKKAEHCPAHLTTAEGCDNYWAGDDEGAEQRKRSCVD